MTTNLWLWLDTIFEEISTDELDIVHQREYNLPGAGAPHFPFNLKKNPYSIFFPLKNPHSDFCTSVQVKNATKS